VEKQVVVPEESFLATFHPLPSKALRGSQRTEALQGGFKQLAQNNFAC